MVIHPSCHCSGLSSKLLHIKFNNSCNGSCDFCIDKNGKNPKGIDVDSIVKTVINEKDYQTVSITGGEPLLDFDKLLSLLKRLRPHKQWISLNTNGSLLTPEKVKSLNGLVDEVRIALHHYEEEKHQAILKTKVSFDNLKQALLYKQFEVVFNMVVTKDFANSSNPIKNTIDLCQKLGVGSIRFSELKYPEKDRKNYEYFDLDHVRAYPLFKDLVDIEYKSSQDLIKLGCQEDYVINGIKVHLKRLCGFKHKENTVTFKVVYSDGSIFNDWVYQ